MWWGERERREGGRGERHETDARSRPRRPYDRRLHPSSTPTLSTQIPATRPKEAARGRAPKRAKTVRRAYGGHLAHSVVKERIVRAFLVEEQKIVKKVLKLQKAKAEK